jgi:hypothetical protein
MSAGVVGADEWIRRRRLLTVGAVDRDAQLDVVDGLRSHTFGIVMFALVALAASAPAVTTQLDCSVSPTSAVASSTTDECWRPRAAPTAH